MKKKLIFIIFGIGITFLSAAIVTTIPKKESYYREQNTAYSPLFLSEIRMNDYVSLPVFEGMEIEESTILENDELAKEEALQEILRTAEKLEKPTLESNCTFVCDMTISRDKQFISKSTDLLLTSNSILGSALLNALVEDPTIKSIRTDAVYDENGDATYDVTLKDIYNMPYPITDAYMKSHTEYSSFNNMVKSYSRKRVYDSRSSTRQETMNGLINYSIKRTTFMEFPESLCDQEFEFLKKEKPDVQYEEAKESLKKIFFISAVLEKYSLADKDKIEESISLYEDENAVSLEKYERERMSYLLFEEMVNNYLYKIVDIKEVILED